MKGKWAGIAGIGAIVVLLFAWGLKSNDKTPTPAPEPTPTPVVTPINETEYNVTPPRVETEYDPTSGVTREIFVK